VHVLSYYQFELSLDVTNYLDVSFLFHNKVLFEDTEYSLNHISKRYTCTAKTEKLALLKSEALCGSYVLAREDDSLLDEGIRNPNAFYL
jgi:hypothetical protein